MTALGEAELAALALAALLLAGSALAAYGLTRRSISGLVVAALGGAIAWRGAMSGCDMPGYWSAPNTLDKSALP